MDEVTVAYELLQQQRLPEAKQVLKKFVKRHPKQANAWFLLSQIERASANWSEAIVLAQKTLGLAPSEPAFIEHLAVTRMTSNEGREMIPAIEGFETLLRTVPDMQGGEIVAANIQTLCLRCDRPDIVMRSVRPYYDQHPPQGPESLRLAAGIAVAAFIEGDLDTSRSYAHQALGLKHFGYDAKSKPLPGDYPYYFIYVQYIVELIAYRAKHPALYDGTAGKHLHMIAESHCLSPSDMVLNGYRVRSHLFMGGKAYYFCSEKGGTWPYQLERVIKGLPKDEPIVVMFGEIDCRAGEGIMEQWLRNPAYAMETEVAALVERYVKFVKIAQLKRLAPTYIYGVPAPKASLSRDSLPADRHADFTHVIRHFNACLAEQAARQGLPYLDVYAATVGEGGWARDGVHIDDVHLTPGVVADLLREIA